MPNPRPTPAGPRGIPRCWTDAPMAMRSSSTPRQRPALYGVGKALGESNTEIQKLDGSNANARSEQPTVAPTSALLSQCGGWGLVALRATTRHTSDGASWTSTTSARAVRTQCRSRPNKNNKTCLRAGHRAWVPLTHFTCTWVGVLARVGWGWGVGETAQRWCA